MTTTGQGWHMLQHLVQYLIFSSMKKTCDGVAKFEVQTQNY